MAMRIRGQEVELMMVVNGVAQSTTTDIRNFEVTPKLEKKQEGYIGETTDRYDEIFKGVDGHFELHVENQDFLAMIFSIIDRAKRRTPGVKINVKVTLNFANGDRPRILLQDLFFENIPISGPARDDYIGVRLAFSCSDIKRI